jgi:hypothetical protein
MLASYLLSVALLKKIGQKSYEINISQDYVGGAWGTHGRKGKCLRKFDSKPEGKRLLLRTIRRWEDIKIDLKEMARERVGWIHRIQCEDG